MPSERQRALVTPDTGASTLVYSRLSRASCSRACAAFTSAAPICLGGDGVVVLLLAHRLLGVERLQARGVALRLLEARLGGGDVGLGARERGLERRRVDGEERLALLRRARLP